jgi:hypothetical protein
VVGVLWYQSPSMHADVAGAAAAAAAAAAVA